MRSNKRFLFLEISWIGLQVQNVFTVIVERRKQVPFSMAIENGELMRECSPEHLRMGTARLKYHNETEEEGKKRKINVERSTADMKKKSCPVTLSCKVTSVTNDSPSRSPSNKRQRL